MRLLQPVHMSDDGQAPRWARSRRRKRRANASPLIGFLVTLLSLFGVLTGVMAVKEGSIARGGAVIDGWIGTGIVAVRDLADRTPPPVRTVAEGARGMFLTVAHKVADAYRAVTDQGADEPDPQ
ncbi:MAG: hypothetical protein ACT6RD_09550 [Brevundimonas sp.]|uniref:hypothetical protein n=1 Tax=Brevundimonas sp. TaxID=1871086 RepID=UPI00403477DB